MYSEETRWKLWLHDQQACEQAIARGGPVDVVATSYGQNDFVLHFLRDTHLWDIMVDMKADGLKKDNGKNPTALNGVEVIRELAGIERIQRCGKILQDTRLMLQAGFNVEEIARANERGRGIIDPETLGHHLARLSVPSAQGTFMEHVRLLRKRRWMRGVVYAADAHEIIVPFGRQYEGLGCVGSKYGFKLVVVINVAEERERIVGFRLAPLQTSEKTMLLEILEQLDREVFPVETWLKILVLDRGYWGAEYLMDLHKRLKIEVVTRAQHEDLDVVKWIDLALADAKWEEYQEERSRLGTIRVKVAGVQDVPLYDKRGKLRGRVNTAVAEEYDIEGNRLRDEEGNVRPRFYYVTTLPNTKGPYAQRKLYLKRWVIENQGFRELCQRWKIDTLVGKSFAATHARLAFVFMLYNAERLLRMKHPGPWQEERKRLSTLGEEGLLGGPALAAYTPEAELGVLSVQKYRHLVQLAERRRVVATLRDRIAEGGALETILDELER